jgi:hypothetical protein
MSGERIWLNILAAEDDDDEDDDDGGGGGGLSVSARTFCSWLWYSIALSGDIS